MRRRRFLVLCPISVLCTLFSASIFAHGATPSRNWHTGMLVETEQTKVASGTTKNTTSDGAIKNEGNKQDYSVNSTSTTTQDYDTYQNYTIDDGKKGLCCTRTAALPLVEAGKRQRRRAD